ncbi:hypothetical protein DFA_02253 [Cavenderia fasciculata]|uniref:Uncharacterized protein n=1 Tax=Cavenderia fasciculata TaxID=261658 RepID=F4PYY1_CACFS|nr:uncharacterized protein DFA_02253 [Cavenderia fasciculata]EGG19010.1 hypothetical protein DFA_02253 [Cavenderia fasciculata]|eukprot:XP_004366643.1 hypothetical protein DFA_02253 [Cavenderia fasciculata]
MNNNNNNNNNSAVVVETCYLIYKLPNTVLLNIVNNVTDNVDLICLLLTCKKLYLHIRQHYSASLQFNKPLEYITSFGDHYDDHFINTLKQFSLVSFRSLFDNSLSNQIVISKDDGDSPVSINNHRIKETTSSSSSRINDHQRRETSILVKDMSKIGGESLFVIPPNTTSIYLMEPIKSPTSLPFLSHLYHSTDIKKMTVGRYRSTEELFKLPESLQSLHLTFNRPSCLKRGDVFPRHLETLELNEGTIDLSDIRLDKLQSLKDLVLFPVIHTLPGFLPVSLTSLSIEFTKEPPSNIFQSLVSLSKLTLYVTLDDALRQHSYAIDLTNLGSLKSFHFYPGESVANSSILRLPLSSSLETLIIFNQCTLTNLSTLFFPTTLTSLDISVKLMLDMERVCLPTTLKKLTLAKCNVTIPVGFIPANVNTLTIKSDEDVGLLEGSIPSLVERLTLFGYNGPINSRYLPNSIKFLSWNRIKDDHWLPERLDKLAWMDFDSTRPQIISSYPSTIRSLDYSNLFGEFQIIVPPSLNSLYCSLRSTLSIDNVPIYSLTRSNLKMPKNDIDYDYDYDNYNGQTFLLPSNLKKLKIKLFHPSRDETLSFRLDDIINQTNIDQLSIYIHGRLLFKTTIKRLDHQSVMLVNSKTLFGGIINQKQKIEINNNNQNNNNNNNNNNYLPFYLHSLKGKVPFWSYENIKKN